MDPIVLGPNQPTTFYRGAGQISRFRDVAPDLRPEDWIASTTARFGRAPSGLTRLPDGALLADAIAAEPLEWLGADHVARYGADPAVLVKFLDPGQRLPVHVHPDRSFATEHLASPYGKTEAWLVLDAPDDASVHLGFARDIASAELATWVRGQDIAALLGATNQLTVAPGDALLCPAGMPHAIGPGVLIVELQEPTDFSVLLEWDGFGLSPDDAALGLPLDLALSCVDRRHVDAERIAQLRGVPNAVGALLPAEADSFFVAERVAAGPLPAGFSILVVTAGSGRLRAASGSDLALRRGHTLVVPYAAGSCTIVGDISAIRCRAAG